MKFLIILCFCISISGGTLLAKELTTLSNLESIQQDRIFLDLQTQEELSALEIYDKIHLDSQEKNGVFLGLEFGVGMATNTWHINDCSNRDCGVYRESLAPILEGGFKWGYQHYFNNTHEIRTYASCGYGRFTISNALEPSITQRKTLAKTKRYQSFLRLDLNLDYLNDFYATKDSSFGALLGIYIGSNQYNSTTKQTNYKNTITYDGPRIGLNVGLSVTAFKRNRFELNAKIPQYGLTIKDATNAQSILYYTSFNAGYIYVF